MRSPGVLVFLALSLSACGSRSALLEQSDVATTSALYVADPYYFADSGRMVRFEGMSGKGWTEAHLPAGGQPCGPALGSDDTLYWAMVPTGGVSAMKNMDPGTLTQLGAGDGTNAQLSMPSGVAIDGQDRIYVVENGANRISRADDMTGAGWVSFGSAGSGTGQFQSPSGIAVSPEGKILIGDMNNHRIVEIDDMSGAGWAEWTMPGPDAQPGYPYGVAYDSESRIYAIDFQGASVHRIDSIAGDGHAVFQSSALLQASHVAVGPDHRIYITVLNVERNIAAIDDMDGNGLTTFGTPGTGVGQFGNPCGIAVK